MGTQGFHRKLGNLTGTRGSLSGDSWHGETRKIAMHKEFFLATPLFGCLMAEILLPNFMLHKAHDVISIALCKADYVIADSTFGEI